MKTAVVLVLLLGLAAGAEPPPDAFARALTRMGIAERDLGYRPLATWARYPHPATTPHVLPFFPDLLARPLDTYPFAREIGNAVEDLLTPEVLLRKPGKDSREETLFRLGVLLGTDRLLGGFRGYSVNLAPRPEPADPLYYALVTLLERSGKPLRRPMAFGNAFDAGGEHPADRLRAQVAAVPADLHVPLARLVLNLVEAREWIDLGLRRVPPETREAVFAALPSLAADTPDGTGYHPAFDDTAGLLDRPSLYYGCLKALQAAQDARRDLDGLPAAAEFALRLDTPWGEVSFSGGPAAPAETAEPFLVVAFGPPPAGPLAATTARRTLSAALLLSEAALDAPALARGVLGAGVLYAAGPGRQTYRTGSWGLGCGVFGLGALVDEGGNDRYEMAAVGEGAGFFGIGLLLDAAGDDEYLLGEGDGQGYGGPGGVGVLGDRAGNDSYRSEPDAAKAGRADYHSQGAVAVSNAMGVGSGRRGDGSDGHNWAGGLGVLADVDGNDSYVAGNFSLGLGYWYGTGLLWDGGGDDEYRSVYFTQGSGAHFAVGALIDESGDDLHVLGANAGAAYGFGWDVVFALLLDRGTGNDRYLAKCISTGLAEVRSNSVFVDEGGDDLYVLDAGARGFGDVDEQATYTAPARTFSFPFRIAQVGLFIDLGGVDRYERRAADGTLAPDADAGDNREWHRRVRDFAAPAAPNVSLGLDLPTGRLGFLDPWPARAPVSR